MNYILTEIGYFGPLTLFLAIFYLTYQARSQTNRIEQNNSIRKHLKSPNVYAYIVLWQSTNYTINELLKRLIKQPRPQDIAYINTWDSPPHLGNYGMPSGHAQQVISEATFIILAFQNQYATFAAILISILTIYQRYIYHKHTVMQLAVGSIIGAITGSTFYIFLSNEL